MTTGSNTTGSNMEGYRIATVPQDADGINTTRCIRQVALPFARRSASSTSVFPKLTRAFCSGSVPCSSTKGPHIVDTPTAPYRTTQRPAPLRVIGVEHEAATGRDFNGPRNREVKSACLQ
jgi:hypothetical protein